MGKGLQQVQTQRRQQEPARSEPTGQQLPSRSACQPPSEDEQFASAGNQARSDLAGARLADVARAMGVDPGAASGAAGAPLAPYRAKASESRIEAASSLEGFLQAGDLFHLSAKACASGLAQLEEEGQRWSFLGITVPCALVHEQGVADYQEDMAIYARFSQNATRLGPVVEATRALADDALAESDALRLMLVEQGIARIEDGRLILDQERVSDDRDAAMIGFALAGVHFDEQEEEVELAARPDTLVRALEVGVADMNAEVAVLRSLAAARKAEIAEEELAEIEELIGNCAVMADLAVRACALGGGGAVEDALDPEDATTAALRFLLADKINQLDASIVAFRTLEGAEKAAGRKEEVKAKAQGLASAVGALAAWHENPHVSADSYVSHVANLGSDADARLQSHGIQDAGVGAAAARRAAMVATRRALAGVVGPLTVHQGAVLAASQEVHFQAEKNSLHHRVNVLRGETRSVSVFYDGVHKGLACTLGEVLARHDELAAVGDSFVPGPRT